jgi:hypothetical protein
MMADAGVPAGSCAVLIGVSAYEYAEFPPIRAARNSLQAMRSLLSDPALCAWPAERITVIANPISAAGLAADLADLARSTTGVLLLYYVGHGLLSVRGELCLTVTSTHPDRPETSGLPWDTLADVLRDCSASARLAILDCCFAGQAIEALTGDGDPGLADIAHIEGVYTLTATTRNRTAHVPPPGQQEDACTSFTGELRDLIQCGIPGKAPRLTFSDIYPVLRQRLLAKGLPAPSQRGIDAALRFPFTANAAVAVGPHARSIPPEGRGVRPPAGENSEPAQPGRSRHTRIVTDALRAAQSITDENSEARALVAIAGALAATDPGRAGRLIADAERVAQSIPDADRKAAALAAVAGPLAATDPDRAERVARSIPGADRKAAALAAVAGALAATDPGRAGRLVADAERAGESIPDADRKAAVLAAVVEALAATDPDRAERVARSIPGASSRAPALAVVAVALAATDADRAARLIADAERVARPIPRASLRAPALAAVAGALAATDPGRAGRLIADAERAAQSIPDADKKAASLAAVVGALAATDPEHAERVARSIPGATSRAPALAAVARALAAAEPTARNTPGQGQARPVDAGRAWPV